MNEYYGVPTTPGDDYLAHYGVKGMKWGVRRALSKGGARGARALARRYAKDAKHLAKLEKRAVSGKKYAHRAARLAAGAAAAGGAAAIGTSGVSKIVGGAGKVLSKILLLSVIIFIIISPPAFSLLLILLSANLHQKNHFYCNGTVPRKLNLKSEFHLLCPYMSRKLYHMSAYKLK